MTQEILDFLDENVTFLATKGTCGNPRVRPIKSALYKNGKLYFCTSNQKGMYKHMQNFAGVMMIWHSKRQCLKNIQLLKIFIKIQKIQILLFFIWRM